MMGNPAHSENQGEGNREAARRYDEKATAFAHSDKVEKAARDAEKALDGKEGAELKKAEEIGKSKARS